MGKWSIVRIFCNSLGGGKIGAGRRVKLACKRLSVPIFTSDGHPMLLERFLGKKMVRLKCCDFL